MFMKEFVKILGKLSGFNLGKVPTVFYVFYFRANYGTAKPHNNFIERYYRQVKRHFIKFFEFQNIYPASYIIQGINI